MAVGGGREDKEMTRLIMKCGGGGNDGPKDEKDVWSILKFGACGGMKW